MSIADMYSVRIEQMKKYEELLKSSMLYTFSYRDLKLNRDKIKGQIKYYLNDKPTKGVYIFKYKNDILYVGQSSENKRGVQQRLSQHTRPKQKNTILRNMSFKIRKGANDIKSKERSYKILYRLNVKIECYIVPANTSVEEVKLLEHYLISTLQPKYTC